MALLVSIAWRNGHGKVAADGTRQILPNFVVPGNGFLAARLRVAPNGMAAAFTQRHAPPVPEDDRARPGVSCQQQFRGFRLWIETENFLPFGFQNERNGCPQILETFFLRLALPIGAGNFETSRPETAFVRFATVDNSSELFHVNTGTLFGRRGK